MMVEGNPYLRNGHFHIFKVFNSVLKGAPSLLVTALVQLTFFRLNTYFFERREQCYHILASNEQYKASNEQYNPYVDVKIKAHVVKARSFEIILYDHN